jgi:hypothetical protein
VHKYPRCSIDRTTAEKNNLEWVTPGHPLFEALRRHTYNIAQDSFAKGACFYSLQHDKPSRLDFYRARVVDGLGNVIHERLFAVEITENGQPCLREPGILGNLLPANTDCNPPAVAFLPEAITWLNQMAFRPFVEEVRAERISEIDRISAHIELSLTEFIQKADEEIGKAATEVEKKTPGAAGRLAQAEIRHSELMQRRERRRQELQRQKSLILQSVERITSVLVLPHPEREAPEVRNLQPNLETEAIAMKIVLEYEQAQGRQVYDIHEKNLGYDLTSLDLNSGELRLIEVKGIGGETGTIVLTPNEKRVAEDRRDCYWLYVVTKCAVKPEVSRIRDPASLSWQPVRKIDHYTLPLDRITERIQ